MDLIEPIESRDFMLTSISSTMILKAGLFCFHISMREIDACTFSIYSLYNAKNGARVFKMSPIPGADCLKNEYFIVFQICVFCLISMCSRFYD